MSKLIYLKSFNMSYNVGLFVSLNLFTFLSLFVFYLLYYTHPFNHVDEIFHVPQAENYCNNSFNEWDNKISTFPGLYLYSIILIKPIFFILNQNVCNLFTLRLVNVLTAVLNFLIIYSTVYKIREKRNFGKSCSKNENVLWTTWNVSLFPTLYFWNFFYYTETVSSCFVLLMYNYHLKRKYFTSALIGSVSVLMRQTNIVWVGFLLLDTLAEKITASRELKTYKKLKVSRNVILWRIVKDNFVLITGYLFDCLMFVAFVIYNGGIVVGDRSAHKPHFHFVQIFYFSLFCIFFGAPLALTKLKKFLVFCCKYFLELLILLIIFAVIIYYNTMVHPYLLADNRHLSFYIWKRVYEKFTAVRYCLIPVYMFGLYFIFTTLEFNYLTKLSYWFSLFLLLIPQRLMEFRYFILPFIMFRLNYKHSLQWQLLLETLFYISINCFVFYVYINKTVYWNDLKEVQRIGW